MVGALASRKDMRVSKHPEAVESWGRGGGGLADGTKYISAS